MLVLISFIVINSVILTACREDSIPSKIIDKEEIVKIYTDNSEKFKLVAEYLQNIREKVFVEKLEGKKFAIEKSENGEVKPLEITDKNIKGAIEYLMNELKYRYISEDGNNGIYFARQTSLSFVQGIAYSKDGNKPDWGTIEELEQIDGNWYYYKGY